jgi:hypothetical protein
MSNTQARVASATYLNRVGFAIQDNAPDAGWTAAQPKMAEAMAAHKRDEFEQAATLINEAYVLAYIS